MMAKKPKYHAVLHGDDAKAIRKGKAVLKKMSPGKFLKEAEPLDATSGDKSIIHTFEDDIKDGDVLGALRLYKKGQDGRHRAKAAKNLGVKEMSVVDYRKKAKKATGGPVLPLNDDDPNAAFRRLISWSFAVAPLFGRAASAPAELRRSGAAEGGAVNRHAYAKDGGVEGDVAFAPSDLPTFARQDPQEAIRTAVETAKSMPQPKKEYKPFGVLPLREDEEGVHFDPYAGALGAVTRPAKYFYETMSGQKEMDPTSDEAIRNAVDLAGSMTLGSGAFERPAGALAAGASRPSEIAENAIRAYHGSDKILSVFDPSFAKTANYHYFADDPDVARKYGQHLHEVNINAKNPIEFDPEDIGPKQMKVINELAERLEEDPEYLRDLITGATGEFYGSRGSMQDKVMNELADMGYDAVRFPDVAPGGGWDMSTVAFDPNIVDIKNVGKKDGGSTVKAAINFISKLRGS